MSKFYTNVERFINDIRVRGYENGRPFTRKVKFGPTLYVRAKGDAATHKSLVGNIPLGATKFNSMTEARDFLTQYQDVHGFDICGTQNYVTQFIQQEYPGEIKFDISLINIVSFDIEVDVSDGYADMDQADKEITSIAYKSSKSETYHLLGRKDFDKTQTITGINPDDIQFMKFDSEVALLRRFIQIWQMEYPEVVTGWNVEYFDIQYIVTRIIRLLGEEAAKKLSPWGQIRPHSITKFGKEQRTYNISGVSVIDYMDAFKKFGYKYGPQE